MGKELDKCSMERDRYRVLVEQSKYKNLVLHDNTNNQYRFTLTNTISSSELLVKTRDQNNLLKIEVISNIYLFNSINLNKLYSFVEYV